MTLSKYRLNDQARFRHLGNEGLIIRQDTAEVISVNDTGAWMLGKFQEGLDLEQTTQSMVSAFETTLEEAQQDAASFTQEMLELGVLVETSSARSGGASTTRT
ncbi:MAG: PqqD family protein [Myxococcales bacterium]|nr:MAG: PqqD family protein [Myxococcales bacterium]